MLKQIISYHLFTIISGFYKKKFGFLLPRFSVKKKCLITVNQLFFVYFCVAIVILIFSFHISKGFHLIRQLNALNKEKNSCCCHCAIMKLARKSGITNHALLISSLSFILILGYNLILFLHLDWYEII